MKLLYQKRQLARKEIADMLGLSFPTVTQLLTELEAEGIVETVGQQASTGGRRAFLNAVVNDSRASVGISVSLEWVRLVLLNMSPTPVEKVEYFICFEDTAAYWQQLIDWTGELLERNHIPMDRLLGVGISFPGIIGMYEDAVEFAPTLNVGYISLEQLNHLSPYPLSFGNDATLAARAETWFKPQINNCVYLLLNRGVGGAFISEGNRSFFGNRACEFGHMVIEENGRPCSCGRKGCLETYCSSSVPVMASGAENLEQFFALLQQGDETCRAVWQEYFDHLVTGIINLRSIFDTDLIIGGEMTQFLKPYTGQLRKALVDGSGVKEDGAYLHFSNYGRYDSAIGAALLNIDKFLDSP